MMTLEVLQAQSTKEIRSRVRETLGGAYRGLFPADRTAPILLKPNLNSNMNALTGNTTDLRLIGAVIEFLKDEGHSNITIGEGTNSGFYRSNINVISRLLVDKLAGYYGVHVKDLNYSEKVPIDFEDGITCGVARECMDAAMLINLPKLKTHFENGMSVCLKNLMGCLVGQENKKKVHQSLAKNILNINRSLRPHLHIVDGLISMEGLGPTRGTPVKTGFIMVGTDPFLIDLACSKAARFDHRKVRTLKLAEELGLLTDEHREFVQKLDMEGIARTFKKPVANPLASFVHSPKRQKYFLAVRNTKFFTYLASTRAFGYLLFKSGLRQDNFIPSEMTFEGFTLHADKCREGCTRCADYCPLGLSLPEGIEDRDSGCIGCQYCFLVCPTRAIEFRGTLGFLADQIRQYDAITREVTE
jgi:uncharacterized protein (DUF362 family)/Pyruvate/2-oxoacid:ferredoxin oxidoreductase delta subunit